MGLIPQERARKYKQVGLFGLGTLLAWIGGILGISGAEKMPWPRQVFWAVTITVLALAAMTAVYCWVNRLGPWQVRI